MSKWLEISAAIYFVFSIFGVVYNFIFQTNVHKIKEHFEGENETLRYNCSSYVKTIKNYEDQLRSLLKERDYLVKLVDEFRDKK